MAKKAATGFKTLDPNDEKELRSSAKSTADKVLQEALNQGFSKEEAKQIANNTFDTMFSSLKFAYQTGEALLKKGLSEEEMDQVLSKMMKDRFGTIEADFFTSGNLGDIGDEKAIKFYVTGLGALTPIGNNVSEYWANLLSGQSGAAPITHFDASNFKTRFACEVKNFNVTDYIDRKEARKQDPYTQYAVVATAEAMKDSNIDLDNIDLDRAGVIWGSGIGGIKTFYDEVSAFALGDGTPRFNPFFIPKMISDIAAGVISIKYGFRGPNFTTVSACASSSNAIIDSFNYIRLGKADIIITGGSEASVNEAGVGGFNAIKALSTRNDSPEKASRPFDKDRDGFVLGEGAGRPPRFYGGDVQ